MAFPGSLRLSVVVLLAFAGGTLQGPQQSGSSTRDEVVRALKQATSYYRGKVASHGGYVYYYSADLRQRWGEGKASPDTIFVQPPGTPTVGMAYLKAHDATGDAFYLDAAREAALALVYGQLDSGGWTQVIHFAPAREMGKYRNGKGGNRNISSLDDGQTQSALQMLFRTDEALAFADKPIHEAALYGLDALLKGGVPERRVPQVWSRPVEPKPILKARYPDYDWRTEGRIKNYWDCYTLNDGLAGTVSKTLITGAPGLQGREIEGGAPEARKLPGAGPDARSAARLVPAIQLRDDPDLGAEVRAPRRYRLGVAGRHGNPDQDRALHGQEGVPRADTPGPRVSQEERAGGWAHGSLLRAEDEQTPVHG